MLGGLEQQIMDVLWSSPDPLKPAQVKIQLKGDHAYTTIMTVLKRMADKKLVKRDLRSNTYYYSPSQDRESFAHNCLDDLFERLFCSYGDQVSARFNAVRQKLGIKN